MVIVELSDYSIIIERACIYRQSMSYQDLVEYRIAQNIAVKEYRKAKKQFEQISLNYIRRE